MPWTRKQVKLLLSSGSPLSAAQQAKVKSELHADPALGHAKKGSSIMKKKIASYRGESHSFNLARPKRKVVSRYTR